MTAIMPDVRIYSRDMELIGFVQGITSLQWNRKYNTMGSFELHCSQGNIKYCALDDIVWLSGSSEAGVIETIELSNASNKRELVVKGRFLSSYLDRRLVKGVYTVTDKSVTDVMKECFTNATSLGDSISIGTVADSSVTISLNQTYASLLTTEQACAQKADLGIRFRPDFEAKKIYFDIYDGVDRSADQTERSRVIFAPQFRNVESAEYSQTSTLEKTVMYVSSGSGTSAITVTAGDDTSSGLDRREAHLSTSYVTKTSSMSDTDFQNALIARGNKELLNDVLSETLDASIDPNGNFKYRADYDLGDIVTISYPDWGLSVNKRLTEISEVYERGKVTVKPKFGTDILMKHIGG